MKTDNPSKKRHDPPEKPTPRPLNPKHYRYDSHGTVHRISDTALKISEKLGLD